MLPFVTKNQFYFENAFNLKQLLFSKILKV